MYYNELYHHGRLGQKWGQKNGPPYPLSRATVGQAYGKKKRGISGYIERRKAKKEQKAISKLEKAASKKTSNNESQISESYEDAKARALRQGNATEVLKYVNDLTPNEINNALNRIRWTQELQKIAANDNKKDSGWDTINKVMKKVGDVSGWAKTGSELYKNVDELVKLLEKDSRRR